MSRALAAASAKWYLGLLPVVLLDSCECRGPLHRAELKYRDEAEVRGFQMFFEHFSKTAKCLEVNQR
jgi:hypothetical protein